MDLKEKTKKYQKLKEVEEKYKKLYLANPEMYFDENVVFSDWGEFCKKYKSCKRDVVLPEKAPTFMAEQLEENEFFLKENVDVSMVFNAKYCPPFWHSLEFIKIMYVLAGSFRMNLGSGQYIEVKEGNFVIVPPKVEQSVFSYNDKDVVVNIFMRASSFEKAFASLLMEEKVLSGFYTRVLYGQEENCIIYYDDEKIEKLTELILDMIDCMEGDSEGKNLLLISYVTTFLAYLISYYGDKIKYITDISIKQKQLPEMLNYIMANYNTVNLTALAERFELSPSYVCRYIKAETGTTLVKLLQRIKLQQAAIMLRSTNFSIERIMLEVGYTDISYFYKVFRKRYQMTPLEYRNSNSQ